MISQDFVHLEKLGSLVLVKPSGYGTIWLWYGGYTVGDRNSRVRKIAQKLLKQFEKKQT